MKNNYKFFKNIECEYYPCHNIDEINCLFCYCPLYLIDDCGGNYKVTNNIKDCSDCLLPHKNNGFEFVNKKLKEFLKG